MNNYSNDFLPFCEFVFKGLMNSNQTNETELVNAIT